MLYDTLFRYLSKILVGNTYVLEIRSRAEEVIAVLAEVVHSNIMLLKRLRAIEEFVTGWTIVVCPRSMIIQFTGRLKVRLM